MSRKPRPCSHRVDVGGQAGVWVRRAPSASRWSLAAASPRCPCPVSAPPLLRSPAVLASAPPLSRGPRATRATAAPGPSLSLAGLPGASAAGAEGVPAFVLRLHFRRHFRGLQSSAFLRSMLFSSSTQELGRKSFFDFQTHGSFLPVLKTVDGPSPWLRPLI